MEEYTKTTSYIAPMISENLSPFKEFNFLNCYLGDHGYDVKYEDALYLRVAPEEFNTGFKKLTEQVRKSKEYITDYDLPNREVMFVFQIGTQYKQDLEHFKNGKYSKIDRNYVEKNFLQNSKRYKVLTRDPEYRVMLEELLSIHLPANAELASIPEASTEIFRFNNLRGW